MAPYSTPATAAPVPRVTVSALAKMAREGTRLAMLTAYDASFAAAADRAGVDMLLVGDSLGNVIQGHATTLPVTLADVVYHTRCVAAGCTRALVIADLPFGTYQRGPVAAYEAAAAALQAGAQMVKLEGGAWLAPTVEFLTVRGVPVCGHIGLQPQSVNTLGGFRVQGRDADAAAALVTEGRLLAAAGAALIVVECVPRTLGAEVTRTAGVPIIGIGAGPECAGQVLVMYDAIGVAQGRLPRFARNFLAGRDSIEAALRAYVEAVRDGSFPAAEHCY